MDFKDFEILQVLYEEKNIKKAADRLFLSQPAISYRIQQLEKELGITILIRGNKGVQFTLHGEFLIEGSRKLLSETEKMIEHLHSMDDEVQGTLKLGVANNFALYKLPPILGRFAEAYPKVKIQLKTGLGQEIMKLLSDGEIHIGIESGGYKWADKKVLIDHDRICIISKKPLRLEDLPKQHIIYIPSPYIKSSFTNWWQKKFVTPPLVTMEIDYVETCKRMVLNGLGVGFVPSNCLEPGDPLYVFDFQTDEGENYAIDTWLNYRESSLNLSIVREFIHFITEKNKPCCD